MFKVPVEVLPTITLDELNDMLLASLSYSISNGWNRASIIGLIAKYENLLFGSTKRAMRDIIRLWDKREWYELDDLLHKSIQAD